MIDEEPSRFRVADGNFPRYIQGSLIGTTSAELFVVNGRLVDLHRVAFQVKCWIFHNVVADQREQEITQELAVTRRARVVGEQLRPEKVAAKVFLDAPGALDFLLD